MRSIFQSVWHPFYYITLYVAINATSAKKKGYFQKGNIPTHKQNNLFTFAIQKYTTFEFLEQFHQ